MRRLARKPCVVVLAVLKQVEGAARSHSGRFCSIVSGDSILLFVLVGGLASECAAVKTCVQALVFSVCDRAEGCPEIDQGGPCDRHKLILFIGMKKEQRAVVC
uniref:Uncharacterized protein n=1 Tax=Physcomitrium patens TaxID=3218 RepID=A0A2K1L4C0_PHYPA|nr:hypothetical protein PHYPA_003659 [Physcomitrium patens]